MPRLTTALALAALLIPSAALRAQEDVGAKVYRAIHPSVASLKSLEGSGTGFAINDDGLILTNAHVMTSPLPYQCRIDVYENGKTWSQVFREVKMIGIHPDLDLALVKVDVKKLGAGVKTKPVRLARANNIVPGETVFAIGNPGAGGGKSLDKTITNGVISATARELEGVTYIQFSAPVNPGNSGGPLVSKKGEILGAVTLKGGQDGVGYAIPLTKFDQKEFVALKDRKVDSESAKKMIAAGDRLVGIANQQGDARRKAFGYYQAAQAYRQALARTPGERSLYFKVGGLERRIGRHPIAAAYLVRGLELDPWFGKDAYVDLGLALSAAGRAQDARVVFDETFSKFTEDTDVIAIDIAKAYYKAEKHFDAAYHARLAAALGPIPRLKDEMMQLFDHCRDRVDPDRVEELDGLTKDMDARVAKMRKAAKVAKSNKTPYVNKPFETLITRYDPLPAKDGDEPKNLWGDTTDQTAKKDAQADPFTNLVPGGTAVATPLTPTVTPKPPVTPTVTPKPKPKPKPKVDPIARRIDEKISLAKLLYVNKQKDKAINILEQVIQFYPDHPDTKKAIALRKQYEGR